MDGKIGYEKKTFSSLILGIFLTFTLLTAALILTGCCKKFKHSDSIEYVCEDGRKVFIEKKNPFEYYKKESKLNLKLLLKIQNNNELEVSANDSKKLIQLTETFNQETSRFLIESKSSYQYFKRNACDREIQKEWIAREKSLNEREVELETLRLKIETILNEGGISGNSIQEINMILNKFISDM